MRTFLVSGSRRLSIVAAIFTAAIELYGWWGDFHLVEEANFPNGIMVISICCK